MIGAPVPGVVNALQVTIPGRSPSVPSVKALGNARGKKKEKKKHDKTKNKKRASPTGKIKLKNFCHSLDSNTWLAQVNKIQQVIKGNLNWLSRLIKPRIKQVKKITQKNRSAGYNNKFPVATVATCKYNLIKGNLNLNQSTRNKLECRRQSQMQKQSK